MRAEEILRDARGGVLEASELVEGKAGVVESAQADLAQAREALAGAEGVVTLSTHAADAIAHEFEYPRDRITPIGAGPAIPYEQQTEADVRRYGSQRILLVSCATIG